MPSCTIPYLPEAITVIGGFAAGYIIAVIQRRMNTMDSFADLILSEIKEASAQPNNIGGEFGIEKWLIESKRRVLAYSSIIDWDKTVNTGSAKSALDHYQSKQVCFKSYRKEHIIELLADIYRKSKNGA